MHLFVQSQPMSLRSQYRTFRQIPALLLVCSLAVSCFFIALSGRAQASSDTLQTRVPVAKAKDVKKLYKQKCVKCHGTDGASYTPQGEVLGATNFTDSEWQERVEDQRLINSMTHGRGQMPAFGKKLSKEQITSLLNYVRAFKK